MRELWIDGGGGYWDEQQDRFVVEPGDFELQIGASSEDIRQTQIISISLGELKK